MYIFLKNLLKFTGKYLSRSHFFNEVAGWRLVTLLKMHSSTAVLLRILHSF